MVRAWAVAGRHHDVDAIGPVKRSCAIAPRNKPIIFWCLALIFLENLRHSEPNRRQCLPARRRSMIQQHSEQRTQLESAKAGQGNSHEGP
jgi:hypothetical protein